MESFILLDSFRMKRKTSIRKAETKETAQMREDPPLRQAAIESGRIEKVATSQIKEMNREPNGTECAERGKQGKKKPNEAEGELM